METSIGGNHEDPIKPLPVVIEAFGSKTKTDYKGTHLRGIGNEFNHRASQILADGAS